ncbi:MAG: NAD(P)H-dependent glycerol-3-phosphate dehydrogenase [Acidimicrobiia bacterium]
MKVAVIGAGSWGTTIAAMLAPSCETILWSRRVELAEHINEGTNPDYLPGFELPPELISTTRIERAIDGADALVMGVPSHGFRTVLEHAAPLLAPETPILSLTKGIEQPTLMRMTEVTIDVLPDHDRSHIGVLTGPNLAREIMAGQPAATVIAMENEETSAAMQSLFMGPRFRVYTNTDVIGSESAGALKNVMALAAGMAEGLGFGLNTVSMLMTRALVEMSRLGVALGGRTATFAGLAGMGDLIATCMSTESRNHRVGLGLGLGKSIDEIVSEMNMVAEGVKSTSGILALADRYEVEMPIAEQVGRVLYEGASVPEAIATLMGRSAKPE